MMRAHTRLEHMSFFSAHTFFHLKNTILISHIGKPAIDYMNLTNAPFYNANYCY